MADAKQPRSMQATDNGQPVLLIHERTRDDQRSSLRLKNTDQDHVTDWTELDPETIIGIFPLHDAANAADLLLIAKSDDGSKAGHLRVIRIEDPTPDIIEDWAPTRSLQEQQSRLQVIVSVTSGTGLAKSFYEDLLEPLLHYLLPSENAYDLHLTTSETSITKLARDKFLPTANAGQEQDIVLLSGDGGLVDILNALLSQPHGSDYVNPNISLFAFGTGNALANSCGITQDKLQGLRPLVWGHKHRELPAFRATFSAGARYLIDEARQEETLHVIQGTPTAFGCVVCSWGLHAALVADSDTTEYRKFGSDRFKMAAKENLYPTDGSSPHEYRGTIKVIPENSTNGEWQSISRLEHGYVLSTLVSHLEAGFNISPDSRPFDGVLRLVHFGPLSGEAAMDVMTKAYQGGQHVHDARIGYEAIRALRIEFDEADGRWRRICIDGKIIRVENNGWLEVRNDVISGINLTTM